MKDLGKINYKYIREPTQNTEPSGGLCLLVVFRKDIDVFKDLMLLNQTDSKLASNLLMLEPCKFTLSTDVEKNEFVLDIDSQILVDYKIKCHLFLVEYVYLTTPDGRKVYTLYNKH